MYIPLHTQTHAHTQSKIRSLKYVATGEIPRKHEASLTCMGNLDPRIHAEENYQGPVSRGTSSGTFSDSLDSDPPGDTAVTEPTVRGRQDNPEGPSSLALKLKETGALASGRK